MRDDRMPARRIVTSFHSRALEGDGRGLEEKREREKDEEVGERDLNVNVLQNVRRGFLPDGIIMLITHFSIVPNEVNIPQNLLVSS